MHSVGSFPLTGSKQAFGGQNNPACSLKFHLVSLKSKGLSPATLRMPPSGKCPVDHRALAAARASQQPAVAPSQALAGSEAGNYPVDHHALDSLPNTGNGSSDTARGQMSEAGKCPVNLAALAAQSEQPAAGKCPVDHAAMTAQAQQMMPKNGQAPQKAVCPFGFGSSDSGGQSMTSLHCPRCRSLFFDCVKTSCGHHFCRECIQVSRECLSCGASVTELTPDADVQDLVDTFISTHSTDETFLEGKPVTVDGTDGDKDTEATKATFLLELGLRSFAGGNFRAASARLETCREQLLGMVESRGSSAKLSTQLGAVCGSQGDCRLRLGDPEAAAADYEASIKHLQACAAQSSEVDQALTVTLNKLGDLWYRAGNLPAAHQLYSQALALRRSLLRKHTSSSEQARSGLDVALSLAKVADIAQALGETSTSEESLAEAKAIAADLGRGKAELGPSLIKRLEALEAFLVSA